MIVRLDIAKAEQGIMRVLNEELHEKRKIEIMEQCYECYAEYGLNNVGIKGLGKYCNMASGVIYNYFDSLDDLIIQATAHCMSKVENDFMLKAPTNPSELEGFIDEIAYWTKEHHGKKYRLMYQVYTNPKYIEHGKKFFEGVNERYTEYARILEPKLGIPYTTLVSFIFILIRASIHYAMFEDEYYLKAQLKVLKASIKIFMDMAAKGVKPQ